MNLNSTQKRAEESNESTFLSFRAPGGGAMFWISVPVILVSAFWAGGEIPWLRNTIVILASCAATSVFALGLRNVIKGVVIQLDDEELVVRKALSGRITGTYLYKHIIAIGRRRVYAGGIDDISTGKPSYQYYLLYAPDGYLGNTRNVQLVLLPNTDAPEQFYKTSVSKLKQHTRLAKQERKDLMQYCRRQLVRQKKRKGLLVILVLAGLGVLGLTINSLFSSEWTLSSLLIFAALVAGGSLTSAMRSII